MKKIASFMLAMMMVLSLCACISPDAPPAPTGPASNPTTAPTQSTPAPQEDISLTMLCQQMIETPAMFAIAYLGFVHEPSKGTVDQLLEEDFEFVTVSQLVFHRQAKLIPGREYKAFPPKEEM